MTIVTPDTAHEYVTDLHPAFDRLKPAHQADVFRVNVLYEHGGMYIDADTIVLRSLIPLFSLLQEYDLVGADWKPKALPSIYWQNLGVSVLGPMRQKLQFMCCAMLKQRKQLDEKAHLLDEFYPFEWEELLSPIVNLCFDRHRPRSFIIEGASSWFSYVSGPSWKGGDGGYGFFRGSPPGGVELFTLANSLVCDEWKNMDKGLVMASDTIVGKLLRLANGL